MRFYKNTLILKELAPEEQTLKEFSVTKPIEIKSLVVFAEDTTVGFDVRIYKKDDGGDYREIFTTHGEGAGLTAGISLDLMGANYPGMGYFPRGLPSSTDVKITVESAGSGSGNVEISCEIAYDFPAKFAAGAVWIDADSGISGTDDDKGTAENPVANFTNGCAIALLYGLNKYMVKQGTGNTNLPNNVGHYSTFEGISTPKDDGGFEITGSRYGPTYVNIGILKAGAGSYDWRATFIRCVIWSDLNILTALLMDCVIVAGKSVFPNSTSVNNLRHCHFNYSGLDFTNVAAGGFCFLDGCTGILSVVNLTKGATLKIFSKGGLKLSIAASCTAGTIEVYGPIDELLNLGTSSFVHNIAIPEDMVTETAMKDLLFFREVNSRHANGKPQSIAIGAGGAKGTVTTTLDGEHVASEELSPPPSV